jgi:hypothetical protein
MIARERERVAEWDDSKLLSIRADNSDFSGPDLSVDPDE